MSATGPNSSSRNAVDLAYLLVNPTPELERDLAPIILLHGVFGSKQHWKFMMQDLANRTGRKVYALDQRNHGESPWSDEFDMKLLALDLGHFLQQHDIAKAVLVGQSMGAKTIMTFVLQKPEKAEKVVFEDMYVRDLDDDVLKLVHQMFQSVKQLVSVATNAGGIEAALRIIAEQSLSTNETQEERDAMIKAYKEYDILPMKEDGERYIFQGNPEAIEKTLLIPGYYKQCLKGEYHGDALFIYGPKSFFDVPSDSTIPKLFPRAKLVGIEGAAHDIHTIFPEKFLDEVVKFINSE